MAENKKKQEPVEVKADGTAEPVKKMQKEKPWEHFKQTNSFKNMKGFAGQHMNRRVGPKGG
ncbi:MAG TPA: hypothetical protein PKJ42_01750 [Candidatus Goldiibacteriota bacterium]|nr:hypothetical protein [Candidatus Goldiibacteriota bacterium]